MKDEHKHKGENEPRPKENQEPGAEGEGAPGKPGKKGAKKPYVFKFQPADPKNDLEFEDMADK